MELINQSQILLTLPNALFKKLMHSAYAHDRDPIDEIVHRLWRSFEIEPEVPKDE